MTTPSPKTDDRQRLNVTVVGHVDHGKSTLVGRLLADTGNLPEGKLEFIREMCARNSKPLEYAYLLDALKDEQAQGITIDTARCFFKTALRDYIIIDAPGHIEFLKNMVSGASRADAALLVIDAHEGVKENSRRHGYFLSVLGIEQFVVVINKMDLVGYSREVFDSIVKEYQAFLDRVKLRPAAFIPVNSMGGVNVATHAPETSWYTGPTVLEMFDRFVPSAADEARPLRLPVQDVYKFTAAGDERRIIAGRIESGTLRPGDRLLFLPSNKKAKVETLESFAHDQPPSAAAGEAVGVTLDEQIYARRGDLVCREDEAPPLVSPRLRADVFWLGRQPMEEGRTYKFKLASTEVPAVCEKVIRVLDASNLNVGEDRKDVRRHEVGECILQLRRPVAFDLFANNPKTGRFVIVDEYTIAGGGIIREALADEEAGLRQEAFERDVRWIRGQIAPEAREARFGQRAALVVVTGPRHVGRKRLARALEKHLFDRSRFVYYLGMGSVVHGLDADIRRSDLAAEAAASEHVRRLGEMLHVLIDAGLIVICTAIDLSAHHLHDIETLVNPAPMISIRVGGPDDGMATLRFEAPCEVEEALPAIIGALAGAGIVAADATQEQT